MPTIIVVESGAGSVPGYSILITPSAAKEIELIGSKRDRQAIASLIEALAEDPRPHGCEKLSGKEKYRLGKGRYRVVHSIKDQESTVFVVKVGHRKEVYR